MLLVGVMLALLIVACVQAPKEPTATAYIEPPEIKACNDSLEAYAASMGGQGAFEGYQAVYEHFLKANPNSTLLHRDNQSLLDGFGQSDAKIEYYKELQEKNPKSAMYAYLYGRCLTGDESEKMFRKAVELDPKYYWGNFGMASRLISKTPPDTVGAIEYFRKSIDIDNSYPSTFQQLTNIYFQKKDYANALKFADLLAITTPDQFQPIKLKNDILIAQGDKAKAESALAEYATKNPDDPQVKKALVSLYRNDKKYAEAITYQRQIVALSTRNPGDALFDLAKLFAMAGQHDSALTVMNEAVSAGFTDYRRLANSSIFEPLKALPTYAEVAKKIQSAAGQEREMRLAILKDSSAVLKQRTLAGKLDIPAPTFSFQNLEGKTVSLADLKGKVVVIDFWATWCGPCRMTMPLMQEYVDSRPKDVEFLSLNVWERDSSLVRPFLADMGYQFNVLFGDKEITEKYSVTGIPTLVVIDKNGVIRYKHIGYDPLADQLLAWEAESLM
jgi:thiol-disulfide isomerase/thioredoxin